MELRGVPLRLGRFAHGRISLRGSFAVLWDKRRRLPPYAGDFRRALSTHLLNVVGKKKGG